MNEARAASIRYNLDLARETLMAARVLHDADLDASAVNRLYYACFYAVTALLASRDLKSRKHSGVRSLFGVHYVKTGIIDKNFAAFYNELWDARQMADYSEFYELEAETVAHWLPLAEEFIDEIEKNIQTELSSET